MAHKPYFRLIEPGLHIGYRKLTSGPGRWVARRYTGEGTYKVENLRTSAGELVIADDFADADGERVLSFAQAQEKARGPRVGRAGEYTVADAIADYLHYLASDGRSKRAIDDTRYRADAHILPKLGTLKVDTLTADRLRRWRNDLVNTAPRMRTRKGEAQKFRALSATRTGSERARPRRIASGQRCGPPSITHSRRKSAKAMRHGGRCVRSSASTRRACTTFRSSKPNDSSTHATLNSAS
jgi:hypothetical protein